MGVCWLGICGSVTVTRKVCRLHVSSLHFCLVHMTCPAVFVSVKVATSAVDLLLTWCEPSSCLVARAQSPNTGLCCGVALLRYWCVCYTHPQFQNCTVQPCLPYSAALFATPCTQASSTIRGLLPLVHVPPGGELGMIVNFGASFHPMGWVHAARVTVAVRSDSLVPVPGVMLTRQCVSC